MNPNTDNAMQVALGDQDDGATIRAIELDWYAEEETVSVTPRDQQRFEVVKDRAIEILRLADRARLFQSQFDLLLKRLAEWINDRQNSIHKSVVTLQDGTLAFVVVRSQARYDEDFEDDLAELDFQIASDLDLDLIEMKTLALPNVSTEALRSFLDERLVLTYEHGERTRPHQSR